MVYGMNDAPASASSAVALFNPVLARRDPSTGWSGAGLAPPLRGPVTSYQPIALVLGVSRDFSATLVTTTQPIDGAPRQAGYKVYRGRIGGGYQSLTPVGGNGVLTTFGAATADFSHVYFTAPAAQVEVDPVAGGNTYSWSADGGLHLMGILPDETPAPNGATLVGTIVGPVSENGTRALFRADGVLYVRIDDARTVEVGGPFVIDPGSPPLSDQAGITSDGKTVLFTSRAELTSDANTGPLQAGRDLYSYDVATRTLKDLTPDSDPADAAKGADVGNVLGATANGSYIYFTATGQLAPGAPRGRRSLYFWHDGAIRFVADAEGMYNDNYNAGYPQFDVTPDGRQVLFASVDPLTSYDNVDPVTHQPHVELFTATPDGGLECVSCRTDGTAPTGDALMPQGQLGRTGLLSEDHRRVFFSSTDAVVPQAAGGVPQIFEYENGNVSAISPLGSTAGADLLAVSPSGDDVFFKTAEGLLPNADSGPGAVIDARVGGGFPMPQSRCSGVSCRAAATPASVPLVAATSALSGDGDVPNADAGSRTAARVSVAKVKTIRGTAGALMVSVPGKGRLTVSGAGLQTRRSNLSRARAVDVRLVLTAKAARVLRQRRLLKTKAKVTFVAKAGATSTSTVSVTFRSSSARKGR